MTEADGGVTITVKGPLHIARFLVPGPLSFLAFRVFTVLFARSEWLRRALRYRLARLLVMDRRKGHHAFERTMEVTAVGVRVKDTVLLRRSRRHGVARILFGVDVASIFVPISKAFDISDTASQPAVVNRPRRDEVEREVHLA